MKIFGREPALFTAMVASLVMVIAGFVLPLTPEQQGAINAVTVGLVGLITGLKVASDGGLAIIVGLWKSVLALGIAFGLHLPPEQQAVIMTLVTATAQFFVRTQVTASEPG